ncbi:MAG: methylated-DNA--[protein]-cysteine S-methyltransferase [Bradymonadaceae bacterium]|nr:methylated-DNA--[protein]-cysteine S-methyltransferase [Lujinxingiaceae bacterium]
MSETFGERVYWLVAQIPFGQVASYGQLALLAGSPGASRAVGNLMRNSLGRAVAWHRVINSRGGISSKGDFERAELQRMLLEGEGVEFNRRGLCSLERFGWNPEAFSWES